MRVRVRAEPCGRPDFRILARIPGPRTSGVDREISVEPITRALDPFFFKSPFSQTSTDGAGNETTIDIGGTEVAARAVAKFSVGGGGVFTAALGFYADGGDVDFKSGGSTVSGTTSASGFQTSVGFSVFF